MKIKEKLIFVAIFRSFWII